MLCPDEVGGVSVTSDTLLSAFTNDQPHVQLPRFSVRDRRLRITTFPVGLAGMRVQTVDVESNDCLCFEMSEKVCRFLRCCRGYHTIQFALDNGTLAVAAESACSALRREFPDASPSEDIFVEVHPQDVGMTLPTVEWLNLWQTAPDTGEVTVTCQARKKTVVLTHGAANWAAVVQAHTAPARTVAFVCHSHVAKLTLGTCPTPPTFSTLTFMKNGPLKWTVGNVTVYLAPVGGV
tara:strand:- start:6476 stop:7180 length:705 start_codon:yes stop_codon:yes gene_type:complete